MNVYLHKNLIILDIFSIESKFQVTIYQKIIFFLIIQKRINFA